MILKRSNVIILMLDTYYPLGKVLFKDVIIIVIFPLVIFLQVSSNNVSFFSDIQIHEAVILNPSNVFDFIFQQYFVYTFNPGVLHINLTLCFYRNP